jgi:C-terminal processing protease CtpA/Prc
MHPFNQSARLQAVQFRPLIAILNVFLTATSLVAQPPLPDAPRVGLFDTVATVLRRNWPDPAKRRFIIEPLIAEHAPFAARAKTFGDEIGVVQHLLRQIPSSHLSLMSATAYQSLSHGLRNQREPMFGMQLMRLGEKYFAASVLDGGPAARAGINTWDEVVTIDSVPPALSGRLDFSTDDAYLPDDVDPPMQSVLPDTVATVRFQLRSSTGVVRNVAFAAEPYSAWEGSAASLRVIEQDGLRIGYLHLFYMHMKGGSEWLSERFSREWANVDALVLDLRGRGGDGALADEIAEIVGGGVNRRFRGPVVALQDRQTRSAKEILLSLLHRRGIARLVGEPSAGAVVASRVVPVGNGMILLMPDRTQFECWAQLELHRTPPDVHVEWRSDAAGSADPILQAGLLEVVRMANESGRGTVLPAPVFPVFMEVPKLQRLKQP